MLVIGCLSPFETHLSRAATAASNKDYEKAIIEYTKVIEIDPDNALSYSGRGSCYFYNAQYDLAIEDFTRAIELKHLRVDWDYDQRGLSYLAKGEYDLALIDITKAIEISPNPLFFNDHGLVYHHQKYYDLAISDFTIAIQLDPTDPRLYSSRADSYMATGQDSLAIADLNKIIQFAHDNSALMQSAKERLQSLGITD